MQYASRLPYPSRSLVVPLVAATLGAGVATATFAVVNIEDQPSVSLPTPTAQPAPSTDAVAGQRNDRGPVEGAAQQIMTPATGAQPSAPASGAARYDGGPNEGTSVGAISQPSATASGAARYDGGPNEGTSAGAISQPAGEGATPFSGARP